MNIQHVLAPGVAAHLADGLEEGQALDVADRAADLDDHHVGARCACHRGDARLDLVRDVRDHLDRAAEEVAPALARDDRRVDLPRGDVATRGSGSRR